ncbi:MAG: hypothetical protein QG671_4385 [Actinomycetota bacterium]|nr:hypothetical protein [Actinomycetota bacterium]
MTSNGTDTRRRVITAVAQTEPSLPVQQIAEAVDVVADHFARLRSLAAALDAHPDALAVGAPPIVGRLVEELIACGSSVLRTPACAGCGVVGRPLTRTDLGGMCGPCAHRHNTRVCARCGIDKPVAGRTGDGQPICERCRRHTRGHRQCGICGKTTTIVVRARDDQPDICANCYRRPEAVCSRCGRLRQCSFAETDTPICPTCTPRATAVCAHCGQTRPPSARWPEGPVCGPCYDAALKRRGPCAGCGTVRRLIAPPGPAARLCAGCADGPDPMTGHVCGDCGREDKLYEPARCAFCALRRRAALALTGATGQMLAEFVPVFEAIVAARNPRTALNWLRKGAGAAVLAEIVTGQLEVSHDALDAHPHRQGADYLRHVLVASGALPDRDENQARLQHRVTGLLAGIDEPADRRLVQAYATWRVLHQLRRRAAARPRPRTPTRNAHVRIAVAVEFLTWLRSRHIALADVGQSEIDLWLTTAGPAAPDVRDFLTWAADHHHAHRLTVPGQGRRDGPATSPDQRWALLARLLHDDTLDPTDRVAGALLLCYGQQLSRITTMTRDQIIHRDHHTVLLRFGRGEITVPEPLAGLLLELLANGRPYVGVGTPDASPWLFPGGLPGRPLTAARLGERLRLLGIYAQAGRRATLTQLAATLPAPTTAVRWVHQAGGDWNHYAAELAQDRIHQP